MPNRASLLRCAWAVAAALPLASAPAVPASALDNAALERILPPGKAVCFERVYSRAELARAPGRNLVHLRLYRTAQDLKQDEGSTPQGSFVHFSMMSAYQRPAGVSFLDGGVCMLDPAKARFRCARACDGQGITLSARADGKLVLGGFRRSISLDCDEVARKGVLTSHRDAQVVLSPQPLVRCDEAEARKRAPWIVYKRERGG